jgi:hypothetical protein
LRTLVSALLLALPAAALSAAEFRSLELVRDGDDYRVLADVFIDAPGEGVFEVLTDYEGFPRLSSVFLEGRVIEPIEDGRGVVYLHMKGCVLFFCREVEIVEFLEVEPPSRIVAIVDPERSDLHYGQASWSLAPAEGGTLVTYELDMRPQFWIPPVIGPLIIKAALRYRGLRAARRLEALASGRPVPEDIAVKAT